MMAHQGRKTVPGPPRAPGGLRACCAGCHSPPPPLPMQVAATPAGMWGRGQGSRPWRTGPCGGLRAMRGCRQGLWHVLPGLLGELGVVGRTPQEGSHDGPMGAAAPGWGDGTQAPVHMEAARTMGHGQRQAPGPAGSGQASQWDGSRPGRQAVHGTREDQGWALQQPGQNRLGTGLGHCAKGGMCLSPEGLGDMGPAEAGDTVLV